MDPNCPLCRLCDGEVISHLYYEDDKVIVVDCSAHNVPMFVIKRHAQYATAEEFQHIERLRKRFFGHRKF